MTYPPYPPYPPLGGRPPAQGYPPVPGGQQQPPPGWFGSGPALPVPAPPPRRGTGKWVVLAAVVVIAVAAGIGLLAWLVPGRHDATPFVVNPEIAAGDHTPRIMVGGQQQPVAGEVVCRRNGGYLGIMFGDSPGPAGVFALLRGEPPRLNSAHLGIVDGVDFFYIAHPPAGFPAATTATVTKDGNRYTITGSASGVRLKGGQIVTKPFEIDVTCP